MPLSATSMAGSAAKFVHAVVAVLLGHTVPGGGLGLGGVPATSKVTNDVAAAAGPDMDHARAVTATSAAARTGPLRGERTLLTIADLLTQGGPRHARLRDHGFPYPPDAPRMHRKPDPSRWPRAVLLAETPGPLPVRHGGLEVVAADP